MIVPKLFTLCEVAASPARIDPFIVNVTLDPVNGVQVTPSLEVKAVYVLPERDTFR